MRTLAVPTRSQPFAPAMRARARAYALKDRFVRGDIEQAAVVGVGLSGLAARDLLESRGATVTFFDDKTREQLPTNIQAQLGDIKLEPLTAEGLSESELVVLSPGVPRVLDQLAPAVTDGRLVGEVELASWLIRLPMIGITGSNGKSTVTSLVAHMLTESGLKAFAGGNLGEPLSRLALNPDAYDVAVVELSSYQLESIVDAQFDVACWLNLMPDHLERYASVDAYAAAKRRLLERRRIGGVAVLNAKDSVCADAGIRLGGATRWFSRLPSSDLAGPRGACGQEDGSIIRTVKDETEVYRATSPALIGLHGLENAAAAIECARHLNVEAEAVQRALQTFEGLPHRLQRVSEAGGVTWYNDSKATNPAAVRTALDAMSGPVVLILGGKDKAAPWDDVLSADAELRGVLLVGAAAEILAPMFPAAENVGTIDAAVTRAAELAVPGDAVLLSPGCASYDQFNNFEERGDAFSKAVLALGESEEST